jgi:flagellar FliJ protein
MTHRDDRALAAVRRVRELREQDSRVGLAQAVTAVRDREAALGALRTALAEAAERPAATGDELVILRGALATMAGVVREAEVRLDASRTVATEAHHRWQADRTRVRAIDLLLERRAAARAETADRAETRELDDVVARRAGGAR